MEENDDTDTDDCAFCAGRTAAHRGEPESANPHPPTTAEPGSDEWLDSDFTMWNMGHSLGAKEPGGVPWYARYIE